MHFGEMHFALHKKPLLVNFAVWKVFQNQSPFFQNQSPFGRKYTKGCTLLVHSQYFFSSLINPSPRKSSEHEGFLKSVSLQTTLTKITI